MLRPNRTRSVRAYVCHGLALMLWRIYLKLIYLWRGYDPRTFK